MVLEAIFNFGIWLFSMIANAMPQMAPVMADTANTLWEIASLGVWVIGDSMWNTILISVTGWLTFKMIWGIILFIYRLIPLI